MIEEQRESGKDTTQTRSHTKEKQIDSGRTDEKEEQEEEKQRMGEPIEGKLIINDHIITYLCDPGAHRTVMASETYERLNTPEQPILLQRYQGPTLKSCSENIKVLGEIEIPICTMSTTH